MRRGRKTLISWGMGGDSTAAITRLCADPTAYGLASDMSDVIVVVAMTGDEWEITMDLAERHILPVMRRHRIRLVQVARGGALEEDGVRVLSDTRFPRRLWRRGDRALSDELAETGTVPQYAAGERRCSLKYKGWVIDTWARAELGDRSYRHLIGYEASTRERGRAARYDSFAHEREETWYPLIEWGWERSRVLQYLEEVYGVANWPKSYCVQCPFPAVAASREEHLRRCRDYPQEAVKALRLEYTARALNPRSTLYSRGTTLIGLLRDDGNTAALDVFGRLLDQCTWSVYAVRRVYMPGRDCRHRHGKGCTRVTCLSPLVKGQAWRSVRCEFTGSRAEALSWLRSEAAEMGSPVVTAGGISRASFHELGEEYPAAEGFLVAAPAGVDNKERPGFWERWEQVTSGLWKPLAARKAGRMQKKKLTTRS